MRLVDEKGVATRRARPVAVTAALVAALALAGFAVFAVLECRSLNNAAARGEAAQLNQAANAEIAGMSVAFEKLSQIYSSIDTDGNRHAAQGFLLNATSDAAGPSAIDEAFIVANGKASLAVTDGLEGTPGAYEKYAPWVTDALNYAAANPDGALRGTLHGGGGTEAAPGEMSGAVAFAAFDGLAAYFISAQPLRHDSDRGVAIGANMLIGVHRIGASKLLELSLAADVNALTISSRLAPGKAQLILDIPSFGTSQAVMNWSPRRPGDAFLANVSIIMVALTALFAALVAMHTRRVMTDLSHSEAQARYLAGHDKLSGLPNRRLFGEVLEAETTAGGAGQAGFALFCLDLDRFKEINDTLGHDAGDAVICEVARRIQGVLDPRDMLARIGGDEFALVARTIRHPAACAELGERILAAMRAPLTLGRSEVQASLSIGVACYPAQADDRAALMRKSDIALYRAKLGGRSRCVVFEADMNGDLHHRKTLEQELRSAVKDGALALRYQPVVSADLGATIGVEALVCWPHPELGLVPPEQFIPLAEERGLMPALGGFVMRQAMLDAVRWPGLRVAINVSPLQFQAKGFASHVRRCLAETGLNPGSLEIELTEGVLKTGVDAAQAVIAELRGAGVRVALDDFGAGYSSLLHLRRFQFDKIKIARAFLPSADSDGPSAVILQSIASLGRALGLTIAAKGVETTEQQRLLQVLGCHELQGYLFSPALAANQIDKMFNAPCGAMEAARDAA